MPRSGRPRRRRNEWIALALGLAAIGLAIAFAFARERRTIPRITLTAGFANTTRAIVSRAIVESAAKHGLDVRLVAGSDNEVEIEKLDTDAIDFALISGVIRSKGEAHVREVAPLYVEALHLLVKEEIAGQIGGDISGLHGRTVDLGPPGTATAGLAVSVLSFAGLTPGDGKTKGTFVPEQREYATLEALIERGDRRSLPDAVFHLATVPSKIALRLIRSGGYRLVAIPFGEAFRLTALVTEPPTGGLAANIDRRYVNDTIIPAFVYRTQPPEPAEPMHTLGTRLLLVASDRVPPATVEAVLGAVFDRRFAGVTSPPLDQSVLSEPPRMELHPGAVAYLQRQAPVVTHERVDELNNSLGILGALVGGTLFLWQWRRQRTQSLREENFGAYMQRLAAIERRLSDLELAATLELDPLVDLQRELLMLKNEALDRFAAGEIGNQAALADLLMPINSTRDHIGDLILHVRDAIEEKAGSEGKSAQALWTAAIEKGDDPGGNPPNPPRRATGS